MKKFESLCNDCLLYTSDAADERSTLKGRQKPQIKQLFQVVLIQPDLKKNTRICSPNTAGKQAINAFVFCKGGFIMTHYKFVSWDIPAFETILTGRIPAALLAADNGNLQPLKDLHIATQTPIYKCSGWCIPFAEYMRRFWVKTKYYGIIEMYALNKTDIRKELKSNIIEIMEVKKN